MTDRPRHAHYNMTTMALAVELTLTLAALTLVAGVLPAAIAFVGQLIVDGVVNGTASFARGLGNRARRLQSGNTRSYATWVVLGAVLVVTLFVFRILS